MKATIVAALFVLSAVPAYARTTRTATAPSLSASRLTQIQTSYNKSTLAKTFKSINNPQKTKQLAGTAVLKLYMDTLGAGSNQNLVTDGDHLVYQARAKSGEWLVATSPEDSSAGDGLWVFDKSGQKQLAQGTAYNDAKMKLKIATAKTTTKL